MIAVDQLGTPASQYLELGKAYFAEDMRRVGFTFGMTANIWQWDDGAADLAQKVVCEQVPNYLYYQRMASEVALAGLAIDPGNADLLFRCDTLLADGLWATWEYFKEMYRRSTVGVVERVAG